MNISDRLLGRLLSATTLLTLVITCCLPLKQLSAQEILRLPSLTIDQVKPEADTGDPEALYILGALYYRGSKDRRPDYSKAARLFTRAAEQGIALAQMHMGEMYFDGTKIPQNDAEAFRWYQVAALQGIPQAEYGLGTIYEEGRGTAKDPVKAARWYELASRHGNAVAQNKLGIMYANGTGVSPDTITAYKWLSLACTQGVTEAVSGRDEVRNAMTTEQIAIAQREASTFKVIPHYNTDELKRQTNSIVERAKEMQKTK